MLCAVQTAHSVTDTLIVVNFTLSTK